MIFFDLHVYIHTYIHKYIYMYLYFHVYMFMDLLASIQAWLDCTGWRRLIGCLKLQVIFHKRATNCRARLRKMTYADKASYDSLRHPVGKHTHTYANTYEKHIYI